MDVKLREDDRFYCVDCDVNTLVGEGIGEYYMVLDEVWAAAGMKVFTEEDYDDFYAKAKSMTTRVSEQDALVEEWSQDGMLCIGCLEKRLGRTLTPADFMDAPINLPNINIMASERLANRLGFNERQDA